MKVTRFAVENVKSFRERTEFRFKKDLNILIGPNGGGKTNALEVLAITLRHFFMPFYVLQDRRETLSFRRSGDQNQMEQELERHFGVDGPSRIELALVPGSGDTRNVERIRASLGQIRPLLEAYDHPFPRTELTFFEGTELNYRIENHRLQTCDPGSEEEAFLEYLNSFMLLKYLEEEHRDLVLLLEHPILFVGAMRSLHGSLRVQLQEMSGKKHYENLVQSDRNATRGNFQNLAQLAASHFGRIRRKMELKAAHACDLTVERLERENQSYALLTRTLQSELGWTWELRPTDDVSFDLVFRRGAIELDLRKLSSGETELLYFILSICVLTAADGVVLVDEPELHLHPSWQARLLRIIEGLAELKGNQFILATHSAAFVTPDRVQSVTRVYYDGTSSRCISLSESPMPEMRHRVRIVNSQNNERMFFADRVILVEGISDRLVFRRLVDDFVREKGLELSVEVVEVGGKQQFEHYRLLLDGMGTPHSSIADLDYIADIHAGQLEGILERDHVKSSRRLTEKKTKDRASVIKVMRRALDEEDVALLGPILDHLESMSARLRSNLGREDEERVDQFIRDQASKRVFVLRHGELEDYLPVASRSLDGLIRLIHSEDWLADVDSDRVAELRGIVRGALE